MSAAWLVAKRPVVVSLAERLPRQPMNNPAGWLQRALVSVPLPEDESVLQDEAPPIDEAQEASLALQQAAKAAEATAARMADGLAMLAEVSRRAPRPRATEVVTLALLVAREIIKDELRANPEKLITAVEETLRSMSEERGVIVRARSEELSRLVRLRPALKDGGLSLVADESLREGEVIVETATRAVAYDLTAQLDGLRERLIALFEDSHPAEA